uniref:Putative tail protein n=1 Tax=viral metagenome TaxID=1070528 RepID=A0A6H1ZTJ2_9ZZZZ
MADTKLSALTELAATPATDDEIYIRDVSEAAATESKRITYASLMGGRFARNAIINGAGWVYQRAAAYTLVKDTYGIAADRFYGMATGTAVSAGTFAPAYGFATGETEGAHGFQFAGVTLTGTGVIYFRYRMEAADAVKFRGKTASFSCKVKHDVGSDVNYTVYIRKANAADDFSGVTAIANSGAIAITTGTSTALTLLATAMGECQNGVEIEIKVECGAITTKAFNFGDVQFELGTVATPFEYKSYEQELALCQRYYERITAEQLYSIFGVGINRSTTICVGTVVMKVVKRTIPTLDVYGTAAEYAVHHGSDTNTACSSAPIITALNASSSVLGVTFTVAAGLTAGAVGLLTSNNSTNTYLGFSAEL